MHRLAIASGIYQNLMLSDKDLFFRDPYKQAQRALLLADTLLAAHAITDPREPSGSAPLEGAMLVDVDISVRAARADFALRHLGGGHQGRLAH